MAVLLPGFEPVLLQAAVLLSVASGMGTAPAIAAVGIYFGRRSFGMITVTISIIAWVASSATPPLAGYLGYIDAVAGVYTAFFIAAMIASLIGAGLYLMLGQPRMAPSQQIENPAIS